MTRQQLKLGLAIHLIGDYMWIPLFYWLNLPMQVSWIIGYIPFQVVAWAILLPVAYEKRKNIQKRESKME